MRISRHLFSGLDIVAHLLPDTWQDSASAIRWRRPVGMG